MRLAASEANSLAIAASRVNGLPSCFSAAARRHRSSRRVELGPAVGHEPLDGLELGDGLAELPPILGVDDRLFERGRGDADGLRADADAAAVERHHRDLKALVELPEQRVRERGNPRRRAAPCSIRGGPSCFSGEPGFSPGVPFSTRKHEIPFGPGCVSRGAVRAHTTNTPA